MHSNPQFLPLDFIFLLHFLQIGLDVLICFSRENDLNKFKINYSREIFEAFLTPPPTDILSPFNQI